MNELLYKRCLRKAILSDELTRPFAEKGRDKSKLWLDKNENVDPELLAFSQQILQGIDPQCLSIYPDCHELYQKIAKKDEVEPENLLLTAGSDGAIRTVFEACINEGDTVIHSDPTFAMYYVYSKMFGAKSSAISYRRCNSGPEFPLQQWLDSIRELQPKLVCLANPDSPTGTVLTESNLQLLIETALENNSLVLIDEAYFPFYPFSALKWINRYPNLLVARTFAKAWGVAGLRIGYLATNTQLSAYMHKLKPMYEVNTVSLRFMEAMLDHPEKVQESVLRLQQGKEFFIDEMQKLGFKCLDTQANFIHVEFREFEEVVHAALQDKVLFRPGFGHDCLKGFTRFTIATKDISAKVIALIKSAII